MSDQKDQHIPTEQPEREASSGTGGLLAPALDPAGKVLEKTTKPLGYALSPVTKTVGNAVGGITKPVLGPVTGEHEEKAEVLGGGNKDSYLHGKDSLGKREQTSGNPLGLDQTGKFGFRD